MRMREVVRPHAPTVVAFVTMLAVAAVFGVALAPAATHAASGALAEEPILLPGPGEDADGDTYADGADLWAGNLEARLVVEAFDAPGSAEQVVFLVGTQDDHWRTGAGAELEWRHVVDHDALGNDPGSPAWSRDALRTGLWLRAVRDHGASGVADLPLAFHVDLRDDRAVVRIDVEAYDPGRSPDRLLGRWALDLDVRDGSWGSAGQRAAPGGSLDLGDATIRLERASALPLDVQQEVAARWAPLLRFARTEGFQPVPGEALQRFHGFYAREPDLRTWTLDFNNARDGYRLLLADFDGDGRVDHRDARVMTEVLEAGPVAPPTVYAQVLVTTGDAVVVQYWFLYFYNFVSDEAGRDIEALAHDGDREFIQLRFADLDAARHGTPQAVAYSQHYRGVVVPYEPRRPPFHVDPLRPAVFVAAGSHAAYPAAGDDDALRPGFVGYGDRFDGAGATLTPGDYALEVLHDQSWHMGHLWGPLTRHARDFGTSTKPLLQHHFTYPFTDPLDWESRLPVVPAREVQALYAPEEHD